MKHHLMIAAAAGAITLSGCGGYAASAGATQAADTQSAEPTSTGTATMSVLYPDYKDLTALVDKSEVVIQAVVLGSRPEEVGQTPEEEVSPSTSSTADLSSGAAEEIPATPRTVSTVKVTQVLLGDLSVGDELDVLQTGGVSDGVKFVDPEQNILVPGQPETLMFLEEVEPSPWYVLLNPTETTYTVLPNGKLKADNKNNKLGVTEVEQVKEKIKEKKAKK